MAVSNILDQVLMDIESQADQQMNQAKAGGDMQLQQAIAGAPTLGAGATKKASQEMAGALTAQTGQAGLQIQQQAGQAGLQQAGQAVNRQNQQSEQQIKRQQMAMDKDIAEKQRQGLIRQNSAELNQAKELTQRELELRDRMQVTGIEYDDNLSFLTRKQREDLSKLGAFTKQQIFDSRLQFDMSEGERKFSNMRQLADYATMAAKTDQEFKSNIKAMEQAFQLEMIALESAQEVLTRRLQLEFNKAEQDKDISLMKELSTQKIALEKKLKRKAAQAAATTNYLIAAGMIAGVVATGGMGAAAMAAGASAGGAGGQVLGGLATQ